MSRYNLDEADVAEQRTRFELYEKEVGWILGLQGQAEVRGEGWVPASAVGAEHVRVQVNGGVRERYTGQQVSKPAADSKESFADSKGKLC